MASNGATVKENESLQKRLDNRDDKLDTMEQRNVFVGGVIGGAALGGMLDMRFGTIWGFRASNLVAAVAIGAVLADKVSRKNEDMVLALGLGMAAMPVYQKTQATMGEGFFGGLFGATPNGGGGGGNGGGNAGGGA